MRIFLAGAAGAVGRRLVPMLRAAGHEVVGTTTSESKVELLRAAGAEPVVLDALDGAAVRHAVEQARPDVVVHELTALSGPANVKKPDESFALTNRLRTEAIDHLIAAGRSAGAKRLIAQSFTGWTNPRTGSWVKTEDDGLDPQPVTVTRETLRAIGYLEDAVTSARGIEGLALRYGMLYGPGTGWTAGGEQLEMIRARKLPVVGGGAGVWSFVHVDDAASATVAALEHGAPGVYNIVDDEPAPVSDWLPYLARAIGAKPPMKVPAWLVKPMVGPAGMSMMTAVRGSSNAKAKRDLGWTPSYASWREGFRTGLG